MLHLTVIYFTIIISIVHLNVAVTIQLNKTNKGNLTKDLLNKIQQTENESNNLIEINNELSETKRHNVYPVTNTQSKNDSINQSNASVLLVIRDTIKKVMEQLPNTQQVSTNAQHYFKLFEQFLQQAIQQVMDSNNEGIVEADVSTRDAESGEKEQAQENESTDNSLMDKKSSKNDHRKKVKRFN